MQNIKQICVFLFFSLLVSTTLWAQKGGKGFKALEKGDLEKAREAFEKVLEKEPDDPSALFGMSLLEFRNNPRKDKPEEALAHLEKAEEKFAALETKDQVKCNEIGASGAAMAEFRDDLEAYFFEEAKAKNSLDAMKGYIERFPKTKLMEEAIVERNELAYKAVWEKCAVDGRKVEFFEAFVKEYPKAAQVEEAELEIAKIKNTPEAFDEFIDAYPTSEKVREAKESAHRAAFEQAKVENTASAFVTFIRKYPNAAQYDEAVKLRDEAAYQEALASSPSDRVEALTAFLKKYPNAAQAATVREVRDQMAFQQASLKHEIEAYRAFLTKYPGTAQSDEAAYRIADLYHTPGALQAFLDNNPNSPYVPMVKASLEGLNNPTEKFDLEIDQERLAGQNIYITKGSYLVFTNAVDAPDFANKTFQVSKSGQLVRSGDLKTRAFNEGYMFDLPLHEYAEPSDGRDNLDQLFLIRQVESRFDAENGQLEIPYYLKMNYYDLFRNYASNAEMSRENKVVRAVPSFRLNGTPAWHTNKAHKQGIAHVELSRGSFVEAGLLDGKKVGMIPYLKEYSRTDSGWFEVAEGPKYIQMRPGATNVELQELIRLDDSRVMMHFSDQGKPDPANFKPITASAIRSGYRHDATGTQLGSGKKMYVLDKSFYPTDRAKPVAKAFENEDGIWFLPPYMDGNGNKKLTVHSFMIYNTSTGKVENSSYLYGTDPRTFPDGKGGFFALYGKGSGLIRFGGTGEVVYAAQGNDEDNTFETPELTVAGKYFYLGGQVKTTEEPGGVPVLRIFELSTGNFVRDDLISERGAGTGISALAADGISILFLTDGDGKVVFHKRKY